MSSKLKGDLAPSSNKTPYELRLEILHLAQHIVEDSVEKQIQYMHTQGDIAGSFYDRHEDTIGVAAAELITSAKENIEGLKMPPMGVDEVLNIAKKLNAFVSNG